MLIEHYSYNKFRAKLQNLTSHDYQVIGAELLVVNTVHSDGREVFVSENACRVLPAALNRSGEWEREGLCRGRGHDEISEGTTMFSKLFQGI